MATSEANRQRMHQIMLHAVQVQEGVIPEDSPDDFTVPQPVDSKGLPWWFGPDYQATPEAIAEFQEPPDNASDEQKSIFPPEPSPH